MSSNKQQNIKIFASSRIDEYSKPVFHIRKDCESVTYLDANDTLQEAYVTDITGTVIVPWSEKELDLCEKCSSDTMEEMFEQLVS